MLESWLAARLYYGITKSGAGSKTTGTSKVLWQRPTLPGRYHPSTIGAGGLNCRVREGTGCTPTAEATKKPLTTHCRFSQGYRVDKETRNDGTTNEHSEGVGTT